MKNASQVFSRSNCSRKRRRIGAPRSQADENIYVEIDATSDPYRSFCLPISEPSPLSSGGDKKKRKRREIYPSRQGLMVVDTFVLHGFIDGESNQGKEEQLWVLLPAGYGIDEIM